MGGVYVMGRTKNVLVSFFYAICSVPRRSIFFFFMLAISKFSVGHQICDASCPHLIPTPNFSSHVFQLPRLFVSSVVSWNSRSNIDICFVALAHVLQVRCISLFVHICFCICRCCKCLAFTTVYTIA